MVYKLLHVTAIAKAGNMKVYLLQGQKYAPRTKFPPGKITHPALLFLNAEYKHRFRSGANIPELFITQRKF